MTPPNNQWWACYAAAFAQMCNGERPSHGDASGFAQRAMTIADVAVDAFEYERAKLDRAHFIALSAAVGPPPASMLAAGRTQEELIQHYVEKLKGVAGVDRETIKQSLPTYDRYDWLIEAIFNDEVMLCSRIVEKLK